MRVAVRGRRSAAGALSLALLLVPGAAAGSDAVASRTPTRYAVEPAHGIPAALPAPAVAAPRVAFTDDSDRVEFASSDSTLPDPLALGDHTGESTGAERGLGTVLVATQDEPNGEVYLEANGSLGRITCNAAVETHPELSRNGRMVAYSSNESGEVHLWVAWPFGLGQDQQPLPCESMPRVMLTRGPGADLWPSWVDDKRLVFSSTRSDPLGDIWTIPVEGPGRSEPDLDADQLTDGRMPGDQPAAETQPEAVTVPIEKPRSRRGVVFTTTQFLTAGSLAVIELDDGSGTFRVRTAASLWPGLPPPQSSEADYGDSSPPFNQRLNYTTTESDPAGDVQYAYLTAPIAGGFSADGGGTVSHQEDHAETHGSHYESAEDMFASYTTRTQTADVSDVVAADGSARRIVASPDAQELTDERSPTYSPDGTRIAYSRAAQNGGYEIVLAGADGTAPTPLVPGRAAGEVDTQPAWSPDGTRVAFVEQHGLGEFGLSRRRIQVADVASGEVTLVGPELYDTIYDEDPSWSPDSTRLVFARREAVGRQTTYPTLQVMDAQTGSSERLLGRVVCGDACGHESVAGRKPAWSPDGLRIAYEDHGAVRVAHLNDADGNGQADLPETVSAVDAVTGFNADGTATPNRPVLSAATEPAWSPDGSELAVTGQPAGVPDQAGIYALRADGTGLRVLAQDRGPETEPAWQPYGDLAVTLTATASQLTTGGAATLTAAVTNSGPNPAADVVLELDADGLTPGAAPAGCALAGPVLTCTLGELASGAAVQRSLPVVGSVARNNVVGTTVQSPTPDARPENNAAQVTVGVADGATQQPDLSVTLSFGGTGFVAGSGYVGGAGQATVTVTNTAAATATGVAVTTALPAGLVTFPTNPAQPACLTQGVACPLPDLAPGAHAVLVADLTFSQAGSSTSTATVSGTLPDSAPGNNSTSTQLTVKAPKLSLSPDVLAPGTVTVATGTDFPPGVEVNLLWDRGITEPLAASRATENGSIDPVQVFVFRRDEIGSRNLTATATTLGEMAPAQGSMLVVPQRLAPPHFLVRS